MLLNAQALNVGPLNGGGVVFDAGLAFDRWRLTDCSVPGFRLTDTSVPGYRPKDQSLPAFRVTDASH